MVLSSPRRGGGGGVGEEKEGVGEEKGGDEEAKVDVMSDSAACEQEEQQRRLRELQVRVMRSTCRSGATTHVAVCTRRNQVSSRTLGLQHAASPVFTPLDLCSRDTKTRSQNAFSSHQKE